MTLWPLEGVRCPTHAPCVSCAVSCLCHVFDTSLTRGSEFGTEYVWVRVSHKDIVAEQLLP